MSNSSLIEKGQPTYKRWQPWVVCLTAALFFFYEFVQMSMFNAINPSLIKDFSVSATELGNLSAAYFYANIIFMLPAGLLLDRFPAKLIIFISMCLCVAGTMIFSLTNSLETAIICRFLTGIGGSFPFLSCLRLATRWFPPARMALISGTMVTMAMTGGMTAQTPLTLLVENYGWRHAVLIDSLVGILFIILILILVKESPDNTFEKTISPKQHKLSEVLKLIFKNKQNWFFGIFTCMLNLPIFLLAQLWGSLYLMQVHHLSQTQASYATSLIFLGTIIGSPLLGWYSDRSEQRKLPMLISALISLGIMLLIMFNQHLTETAILILFFSLGFFTSSQIISYPAISESNPSFTVGGSLGLASVLIMGGGAVFEPLYGWLMGLHWDHTIIAGMPTYSYQNYLLAMAILPISFIVGIISVLLASETNCKNIAELDA